MTAATISIPTLETARLRLRAPRMADFDAYADFRASERARHLGGALPRGEAFTHFTALAGHWLLHGFGRWIVADRDSDAALGFVGLFYPDGWPEPEISWSLFAAAEGRGIATEAALAARAYAYDRLGWQTVISMMSVENRRSVALARRLGARHEHDLDHPVFGPMHIYRHLGPEARP